MPAPSHAQGGEMYFYVQRREDPDPEPPDDDEDTAGGWDR
jgi:hypothetical protein